MAFRMVFGLMVLGLAANGLCRAEPPPTDEHVWFGPKAFVEGRTVRDDFIPMLTNQDHWSEIASRVDVFKGYIMILPDIPVPGKDAPEISDDEMQQLIAVLDDLGLKTAFEVGGARSHEPGAGKQAAQNEFTHLRRWLDLGGRIDFLTTDHSIAKGLEAWLETVDHDFSGEMTYTDDPEVRELMQALCQETAAYFEEMATLIPGVRFGVIDSLGFFTVAGPEGQTYRATRPEIPELPFDAIFAYLIDAMAERNLELDHFHTDYGYEGVRSDGRRAGLHLDYGRIIGVETTVRSHGIRTGNIINAFHDRTVDDPAPNVANREAFERTLEFFAGYMATGLAPDHIVLQTWQPYPDRTGPEDAPYTVMNLHRTLLRHEAFPELPPGR